MNVLLGLDKGRDLTCALTHGTVEVHHVRCGVGPLSNSILHTNDDVIRKQKIYAMSKPMARPNNAMYCNATIKKPTTFG